MTIWSPDLRGRAGPVYKAIADALAEAIEGAELAPGERLPTHRALARALGVTVGTVSRAYAEAERRGLAVGEVGRGTFVRGAPTTESWLPAGRGEEAGLIDLSLNFPVEVAPQEAELLAGSFRALADRHDLIRTLRYQRFSGDQRQREAGAAWIRGTGLEAEADRVLVCAGAQHALTVIFATLTRPGDLIFTEALTYPGMKSLAQMLNIRLRGLPMDEHGLIPEALERACAMEDARALYCIPTIQNPTTALMPDGRRREIAEIAERRRLLIVEDDVYIFLSPDHPRPLATYAPKRSCYIASTGKTLAPALRISYLLAPPELAERLDAGVRTTVWMASPLTAEIAAAWIREGDADRILAWKRAEIRRRHDIVADVLRGCEYQTQPYSQHVWLRLPEPWRSGDFVAQARCRGVLLSGAEAFAVGREEIPHAVRICIGAPPSADVLRDGLVLLREILEGRSEPYSVVV